MNILFTICGRAGSKGIKNKNTRMFCGNYLVYYTISALDLYIKRNAASCASHDIVLSTDSKDLIDIVSDNGMRKIQVIQRDASLAGDNVGKISVIKDCLEKTEIKQEKKYDLVVDLDITSPLRIVEDIKKVIMKHIDSGADVTTTVVEARRNPYFNQLVYSETGARRVVESNFTARQQAPVVYDMNASIYAYKPSFLYMNKGVLDGYCEIVKMSDTGILDLDHENDFYYMEIIARSLFDDNKEFKEIRDNISYCEYQNFRDI